jgi:hypothetical protein
MMLQLEVPIIPVFKEGVFKTAQKETKEKDTQTKLFLQYRRKCRN